MEESRQWCNYLSYAHIIIMSVCGIEECTQLSFQSLDCV